MNRSLLNTLTLLSLLMSATVLAFWMRSYRTEDLVIWNGSKHSWFFQSGGGQFRFEHTRALEVPSPSLELGFSHRTDKADGPLRLGMMMPGSKAHFDAFGFWLVTGQRWGNDHHAIFLPPWFLLVLTLIPPSIQLRTMMLKLKCRDNGLCTQCGYDLCVTPTRCPECAQIPAPDLAIAPDARFVAPKKPQ